MASLWCEWLKPLSNFKHKEPPAQANRPNDLQKLKCNHSAKAKAEQWGNLNNMSPAVYYCNPQCYASSILLYIWSSAWGTHEHIVFLVQWGQKIVSSAAIAPQKCTNNWLRTCFISTDLLAELPCVVWLQREKGHTHSWVIVLNGGGPECAKPLWERMAISLFDCTLCTGRLWTRWSTSITVNKLKV